MFRRVADRFWADRYAKLLLAMSVPEALNILGFPPSAKPTPQEVTKAYRTKAFENHPDRGGDPAKMVEINVAKDVLENKQQDTFRPRWEPPPREKREPPKPDYVVEGQAFSQAWSSNGPPATTEWKFVSIPEWYWESSNHPGHRIWTMYGYTDSKHIFCAVKERGESAGFVFTPKGMAKIMEDWQVSWVDMSLKMDLAKIAPKYIKSVSTGWSDLAKAPKPPRKFVVWPGGRPTEQIFRKIPRSGGVGLKEILVGAGLLSDQDPALRGRKTNVQMTFVYSKEKMQRLRDQGQSRFDRADSYDFYVIINGKKAKLEDTTVQNLKRRFIPWALGWDNLNDGVTRDITKLRAGRFKGGAAEALRFLADAMTSEPSWVVISLEKAAEEWEPESKTASLQQLRSEMTLFQAAQVLDMSPYDLFRELVA